MRTTLTVAAALLLAANAAASAATAEGPRPSSENHWGGMAAGEPGYGSATTSSHYVWQEGYDRGGKWHGHWVLVQ